MLSKNEPMERYLTGPPLKRARVEEKVHAVIYKWKLDRIDEGHPLYGICYIGQTVRADMTPEKALQIRTGSHISDAGLHPSEIGLHWAINAFGTHAFTISLLEVAYLPHKDAILWADEREIANIADHGGVMRDREPLKPIRQTLNLTKGGRGGCSSWEAVERKSLLKWQATQKHLQRFAEEHGHLRVPIDFKTACGHRLGVQVVNIRSQQLGIRGHPERKKWLDACGFVWDGLAEFWAEAQRHLQAYYDEHGNLRVSERYRTKNGYPLGQRVTKIRQCNAFLKNHPEREEWLNERGFVWNGLEVFWLDAKHHMKCFFNAHNHLRVPTKFVTQCGYPLGQTISKIRQCRYFLDGHPEREEWLNQVGFVWSANSATWNDFKTQLQDYFDKNGHVNVAGKCKLANCVQNIRSGQNFIADHPERAVWLRERGFRMHMIDDAENEARWARLDVMYCVKALVKQVVAGMRM